MERALEEEFKRMQSTVKSHSGKAPKKRFVEVGNLSTGSISSVFHQGTLPNIHLAFT